MTTIELEGANRHDWVVYVAIPVQLMHLYTNLHARISSVAGCEVDEAIDLPRTPRYALQPQDPGLQDIHALHPLLRI